MRATLLTLACLLTVGTTLPLVQEGGLFGPPDRDRGGSSRGGTRTPPAGGEDEPGRPGTRDALPPEVIELGEVYFRIADYNGDGWISYRESRESLGYDRRELFARVDQNRDGRIDDAEFRQVFEMTVRKLGEFPPPKPDPEGGPVEIPEFDASALDGEVEFRRVDSVEELFGRAEARTLEEGSTRQPPFIAGPIPHFRRLDLDLSGEITEADLRELLRPIQIRTRLRAVIGVMDTDESGGISRAEFLSMMSHGAPGSDGAPGVDPR